MEFTFENEGTNTYLVYTISPSDEIDSMSLGMMTNNKIQGLAPAIFQQMDTTKYIKYNISAKISVKQFFAGAVNRKRLLGVFSGIVNAMLSAEEYMIDSGSILLDLDYIYADVSTCETELICVPVVLETPQVDLGAFFKNIVFSTQFDQTENCDYVAKLINCLNSMPVFSLLEFKELLTELEREQLKEIKQPQVEKRVEKVIQPEEKKIVVSKQIVPQDSLQKSVQKEVSKQVLPLDLPTMEQPQVQKEKQMSAMYLMMHYSKENKQKYKQQKEQKKKKQEKAGKQPQNFAIPGQNMSASMEQSDTVSVVVPNLSQQQLMSSMPTSAPLQNQSSMPSQMITGSANFGETTVLSSSSIGETTVLGAEQQSGHEPKPYLIRIKNNERILLDKPVFRIGKEKSYVDYFIGDNAAISRSHASILTRGGEFYIVDTNSTNHTYVNDVMIQSNAEMKISGGTKIRLANEEFEFKLL